MRTIIALISAVVLFSTVFPPAVRAEDKSFGESAADFIGSYLLGKVVDGIWDSATGKPDVAELQERIKRLESSLGGPSPSLDALRGAIHDEMTLDEYKRLVSTALPGVANILSNHERRLQALEGITPNVKQPEGPLYVTSYWSHNGSTMGLLVQGQRRIFVYVKPRSGLEGLVKPGTVLFAGVSDGKNYDGKARRFSAGLDPIEYSVAGPIQSDGSRVSLAGTATVRNRDGSVKNTFHDVLTFDLISADR
jgi:hypothetical protein